MRSPKGTSVGPEEGIPNRPQASIREQLNNAKRRANDALISTQQSVSMAYRTAHERVACASRNLTEGARSRADRMKREHPLQLLGIVAGAAFALGIAARIWRARHHA